MAADLRRAWDAYRDVAHRQMAQPPNLSISGRWAIDRALLRADERMATLPAVTLPEIAIKLRYLVAALDGTPEVEAAILQGAAMPPDQPRDYRLRALWSVVGNLEALHRREG